MQNFQILYRNTQGTLMRILNAASKRGLDIPSVHAEAAGMEHRVIVALEVNPKQVGQLYREWYSITDVLHVGSVTAQVESWTAHPPAGVTQEEARAAARA